MTDDIVARLLDINCPGCVMDGHNIISCSCMDAKQAAAEIERLRAGGCSRDQTTTQFCAEAVALQNENERLRAALWFYAQEETWERKWDYQFNAEVGNHDYGRRARAALKENGDE